MRVRAITTTVLLAAVLGASATACGSSHPAPSVASCRKAIKAQYVPGTATLKGDPTTPPECAGLSSTELSSIVQKVIEANTR